MGIMTLADTSVKFACSSITSGVINVMRTGVRAKMIQEGFDRGIGEVRK